MEKQTILIVEDEAPIREMIGFSLERAGYIPLPAEDTKEAALLVTVQKPSLALIDWMLPGLSGIEFVRRIRRNDITRDLPVIMLTAKSGENDKVQALELGADDYISKPFSPRELMARIRAVLRRCQEESGDGLIVVGSLQIDSNSHRARVDDQHIPLGPTEFRLLQFFMAHSERVYTRSQLLDHVWGQNVYVEERTVDVHIRRLRKSLAEYGIDHMVQTVRGSGYRFSQYD